ncbi:hypothetical protein MTR67_044046 [Solanum verrucosum]|uniref:Reverse transcriptase domain-containing protein n=1 Tax=Solanum verrucosum TaxID=315347 RepID=A0AAF0USK6_SOLVR|nr:hypothetical protein MTR67_044046 [Solanum verrucosum]
MIEDSMEVFMDDFSGVGDSLKECLRHMEMVLKRCADQNLVLNREKGQFMVKEGIVLGHKFSGDGIEVYQAKIKIIKNSCPPISVKRVRSFFGNAGFYRRFIKKFSKIAILLCKLFEKETTFVFDNDCLNSFKVLKEKPISAPIIIAPDWDLLLKCVTLVVWH